MISSGISHFEHAFRFNPSGFASSAVERFVNHAYHTCGKRPDLPINFTALVLPRRKALGVKWNQVFTIVLESDLHRHLVPVHCVAAQAAGFAISGSKPCCADRPAYGQSAMINGLSRLLSEHCVFQHVFSTISSSLKHRLGNVRIPHRACHGNWGNTGATRDQDSYDYGH